MEVATKEHQQKGVTGAVGAAIRLVPPTVLSPVIIATEATSNVLGGMRNQLQPDARKEDEEKWKGNQTWGLDSIDFDWQISLVTNDILCAIHCTDTFMRIFMNNT